MTEQDSLGAFERHLAETLSHGGGDIDSLCAARFKSLSERLSVEQEPYPRTHLTTLRRPIHFLALEAISPNGHPSAHPQQGGVTEPWRGRLQRYFSSVEEITDFIERAVQSGALVVRNASTGIPLETLPAPVAKPAANLRAAALPADFLRGLPLLDNLPHEGVAVRLAEFDEWAARAGIAEAGEVTRLLQEADDRMWQQELAYHAELARLAQDEQAEAAARDAGIETAADELKRLRANAVVRGRIPTPAGDSATPNDAGAPPVGASPVASESEGWKAEARRIADECFDRDTASKCRDSLAGYSRRVMDEMRARGISSPRGPIDNPGTIQRDALQGAKWWANKVK